ncbi:MAG: hypothetical protein V9G08_13180 [Dermatophilaceae bacterium]
MKSTIAKIFEAMLTKDATPTWGAVGGTPVGPVQAYGWDPRGPVQAYGWDPR